MTTFTLLQVHAILSLLIAFGVPQMTVDEVQSILIPEPVVITQTENVVEPELEIAPKEEPEKIEDVPVSSPQPRQPILSDKEREERAVPKIILDGQRDGDEVTFSWQARGYYEPLQCEVDDERVEQDDDLVVESTEPYTLTIDCLATKTGSRSSQSLTK